MNKVFKHQLIMFVIMILVGMCFNPMNILAYKLNDIYMSLTLFYGGLLMASNMIWAHEIVQVLSMGYFNWYIFSIGILLSMCVSIFLLRRQTNVSDKQWLRRMISHHSTALTTSELIMKRTNNSEIRKLANKIIKTQNDEITQMKSMI